MPQTVVTRTQTGVRIESSLLKVLKGIAEYTDLTLGDLLEGIVLHAFEGKAPFSPETREVISAPMPRIPEGFGNRPPGLVAVTRGRIRSA